MMYGGRLGGGENGAEDIDRVLQRSQCIPPITIAIAPRITPQFQSQTAIHNHSTQQEHQECDRSSKTHQTDHSKCKHKDSFAKGIQRSVSIVMMGKFTQRKGAMGRNRVGKDDARNESTYKQWIAAKRKI